MRQLKSRALNLSQQGQKKLLQELDNFKETYKCGDACPVEGYETRRILRCGVLWKHNTSRLQMVEMIGTVPYVATVAVMKISYHLIR